jgi:hypothetical protein
MLIAKLFSINLLFLRFQEPRIFFWAAKEAKHLQLLHQAVHE